MITAKIETPMILAIRVPIERGRSSLYLMSFFMPRNMITLAITSKITVRQTADIGGSQKLVLATTIAEKPKPMAPLIIEAKNTMRSKTAS